MFSPSFCSNDHPEQCEAFATHQIDITRRKHNPHKPFKLP